MDILSKFICIFLVATVANCQFPEDPPLISTSNGDVVGFWSRTWNNNLLASFLSIPYGKPPLGSLRFFPPEPADPWTGTLDATEFRGLCSQDQTEGQEDCLYLDVHAPEGAQDLPVMVYIHGGGLNRGSSAEHFDPVFLGDFGVVLVSLNYRVNVFGFLSVSGTDITGNQGFRDQELALRWVRENIAAFGGNPDQVTIFGQSAGSWSVMHHILSPRPAGLFRAAIGHSGTPLGHLNNYYRTAEQDQERGERVVEAAGCSDLSSTELVTCLQNVPKEILAAIPFEARGVVDGTMSSDPYLPEAPEILLANGNFNQVPLILGATSGESILFSENVLLFPDYLYELNDNWDYYGPLYIFEREGVDDTTQNDIEISRAAKDFYFAPDSLIEPDKTDRFLIMNTDVTFQYGVHTMANYVSRYAPTWQYLFDYEGSLSYLNKTGIPTNGFDLGVAHVDDLQFAFKDSDNAEYVGNWTEQDELARLRMCRMWANFARTLNPTPPDEQYDELGDFIWETVSEQDHRYLEFGTDLKMAASQDYLERMQFWTEQVGP